MSYTDCGHCLHSSIDLQGDQTAGKMVCRRYPPIAVPVSVPTPSGVSIQIVAVFPPVTDAQRCGEFAAAGVKIPGTGRTDN
jgi:hypothetical protein